MQYGQIIFLLFIAFLLYYAGMIVMDIQRAKALQAANQENQPEEDIDISEEAQSFQPIRITRDEPKNEESKDEEQKEEKNTDDNPKEEPFQRPGYREAIMTDGIAVEHLIEEVNRLAETGTSDLGEVIFRCENAK